MRSLLLENALLLTAIRTTAFSYPTGLRSAVEAGFPALAVARHVPCLAVQQLYLVAATHVARITRIITEYQLGSVPGDVNVLQVFMMIRPTEFGGPGIVTRSAFALIFGGDNSPEHYVSWLILLHTEQDLTLSQRLPELPWTYAPAALAAL